MDTVDLVYNILAVFTLLSIMIYLILPVLKKDEGNTFFFISGQQSDTAARQMQHRVILDSIRDLQIEKELGKLTNAEYQQYLEPLKQRLSKLEVAGLPQQKSKKNINFNRLGWYCPECGNLNHKQGAKSNQSLECLQCGSRF